LAPTHGIESIGMANLGRQIGTASALNAKPQAIATHAVVGQHLPPRHEQLQERGVNLDGDKRLIKHVSQAFPLDDKQSLSCRPQRRTFTSVVVANFATLQQVGVAGFVVLAAASAVVGVSRSRRNYWKKDISSKSRLRQRRWGLHSGLQLSRGPRGRITLAAIGRGPAEVVPPPARWSGGGVGETAGMPRPLGQDRNGRLDPAPVVLRQDMRVADVIEALLKTNALCVESDGGEVFYVRVAGGDIPPSEAGNGLFCISLADLLDAPRQMPLDCLLGDGQEDDKEECELYGSTPEPYVGRSPMTELTGRMPWLVGLLFFLTVSSAILEYYDDMLQRHLVIAFYLTALVGCGGNAGSQASSMVLQALATGELAPTNDDISRVLRKELLVALGVAAVLSIGVGLRIALFGGTMTDAVTIAGAMGLTVVFSVLFGAFSPLALQRMGADPAKVSGPLLSTVIDIVGVVVACASGLLVEALGGFD